MNRNLFLKIFVLGPAAPVLFLGRLWRPVLRAQHSWHPPPPPPPWKATLKQPHRSSVLSGAVGREERRRGGSPEGRGVRGVWLGPPSSQGPPMVPTEGGPRIFKFKSSWRQSKNVAVSLKHWKGWRGGGLWGGLTPPSSYGVRPFKYITGGGGDGHRKRPRIGSHNSGPRCRGGAERGRGGRVIRSILHLHKWGRTIECPLDCAAEGGGHQDSGSAEGL